ncbi:hypothetical protein CY35_14G059600 [Sphagnum magellanicum]|nr:hypothetical protein CY35_14G059600 [Sphagnum magellanicum]
MDTICGFCNVKMWIKERSAKSNNHPQFFLCCENGKVLLPNLPATPQELEVLLTSKESSAIKFRDQIHMYNSVLAFTSLGAKVDESFAQLYIHDMKREHQNRHAVMPSLDLTTLDRLLTMMYNINPYVEVFKMARDMMATEGAPMDLKLRFIAFRTKDARRYNVPTADEVVALMVGDGSKAIDRPDVILVQQAGPFQRIFELHVRYMALHYPLLFPYDEDGWHPNIQLNDHVEESKLQRKHCNVTMVKFYDYRFQHQDTNGIALLWGGRLRQQYIVDAYVAIEQNRLKYLRLNKKKLRDTSVVAIRQRIILPSSFTVGPRCMVQNYQDAMAICRWAGCPDVFVTFTCNPQWFEIRRALLLEQQLQDRPDLVTLVFKIKLKELINDIHKNHILGRTIAGIYVVEFQKRGLPHAHILIFLPKTASHTRLRICVSKCPVHGRRQMQKKYPCKFQSETVTNVNGYPIYQHRDTGNTVMVHGIELDNRWVVPHNVYLSTKYNAHINVEVCNNIRVVKYLFKYILRQSDNATEGNVVDIDEIKKYFNCHYVSASEAAWRILKFDMHERFPTEVATRSAISRMMLTEWFKTNQESEKLKRWTMRKRGFAIGRMYYAHPTSSERYYLRMLLNCVKVDDRVHDTLKDACIAMAMTCCERADPTVTLSEDALKDRALYEIDQVLMRNGHRLKDFPTLPKSNYIPSVHGGNGLVQEELVYDWHSLTTYADNVEDTLNDDHRNAYETILNAVTNKEGKLFFVYGSGQGKIVLAVASSGIASLLISSGRTTHSRFKIPIDLHNESTCNITQQIKLAELVHKADLIIWDEVPMMHRQAFETIDRTLCDLMQLDDAQANEKIFGGKTVVLGGDFRQILLVIPKGGREDIVSASLLRSHLWQHVTILRLHINMRVMATNSEEQREFAKWVLNVGNGNLPTIAEEEGVDPNWIEIPSHMRLLVANCSLRRLIRTIYPDHRCHSGDAMYFTQRNILAPKNTNIDEVNNAILESLSKESHMYLNANSLTPTEEGLCNGTRLIVKGLVQRVIEAEIIIGNNVDKRVDFS